MKKSVGELMMGLRSPGNPAAKRIAIYTVRYNLHKYAMDHGVPVLDARTGVGLALCKPDPNLLVAMRDTQKDWHWFMDKYMEQLEESYQRNQAFWLDILHSKKIAVACEYGTEDPLAHRMILRAFLSNIAYRNGMEVTHGGEIHVDTRKKEVYMAA